jgi:[ribosomal protein S5]-alanine N-acetyltransferase
MKLATPRLELVAATPSLLRAELESPATLAALLGVVTPAVWPAPLNTRETVEYTLRFLEGGPDRDGWMSWYFIRQDGRILIGLGGFAGRPSEGSVEVGYSLLEEHQRQGFATEAVAELVRHAFTLPAVDRVVAQTLPELAPSIAVLVRLGFTFDGPGAEAGVIRYVLQKS